jgi:hypothetical protein
MLVIVVLEANLVRRARYARRKYTHVDRVSGPLQAALDAPRAVFQMCKVTQYPKGIILFESRVWCVKR